MLVSAIVSNVLTVLIENKRNEMYEVAQEFGYCSPQVVKASMELDGLINARMKRQT